MKLPVYYATLTGQTAYIAQIISNHLQNTYSLEVPICDVSENVFNYKKSSVIFGCSTYGTGDPNPVAELFLEKLVQNKVSLNGLRIALFGLGESIYPDFCCSVDAVAEIFESLGAEIIQPILKLDMLCSDDEINQQIKAWVYMTAPKLHLT